MAKYKVTDWPGSTDCKFALTPEQIERHYPKRVREYIVEDDVRDSEAYRSLGFAISHTSDGGLIEKEVQPGVWLKYNIMLGGFFPEMVEP